MSTNSTSGRYIKWLHQESRLWITDGLIDEKQAQQIHARYPADVGWSWGLYLLSALGAIVFGLGIILFFAYNWSELHKFVKLGVVFGALSMAHLMALVVSGKRRIIEKVSTANSNDNVADDTIGKSVGSNSGRAFENRNLIEGFHLLGTMMFGAGIWLIAQIYHIDEHFPTAFALWGFGALLLGWALPSVLQGIVAAFLLTVWGFSEFAFFESVHVLSIASLLIGVGGLAFYLKSRTLLCAALIGALVLFYGNVAVHAPDKLVLYTVISSALLFIAAARVCRLTSFEASADIVRGLGIIIYAGFLFVMSFDSLAIVLVEPFKSAGDQQLSLAMLLVTLLCWLAVLFSFISNRAPRLKIFELALVSIALLTMLATLYFSSVVSGNSELIPGIGGDFGQFVAIDFVVLLINAVLAAHCVVLIIIGTSELRWRLVAIGCITLAIQIFWRFGDLLESLLMRSLVFLVVGAILFFIGHVYSKQAARGQADA